MSDYTVVKLVNQALRQTLYAGIAAPPAGEAALLVPNVDAIHIGTPRETADLVTTQSKRLSVFLYQVTEDPFMKNRHATRAAGSNPGEYSARTRVAPMALRFHYMITPFVPDPDGTGDGNAIVLGKVLEVLYDNSTIPIVDPLAPHRREDVRVIFDPLSVADLAEIWEALKEPYRLSVAYQLRVPKLESTRSAVTAPVGESVREYGGEALV